MKKILYSALAMVAMSACSKGEDMTTPTMDNQVRISSSIATRTVANAWEAGDAIGLYMNENEGTFGALSTNKKYTTAQGDGVFDTDEKLFYPPTANVDFLAYYPYSEDSAFDAKAYAVDLTTQDDESAIDLLSAKLVDQAKTPEAVELEFDHKLSRVVLSAVTAGDGVEAADLAGAKIYLYGVATKGSFDLTTDLLSALDTTTPQLNFKTTAAGTSATAIVLPQTLTDVMLKIETTKFGTFETAVNTAKYEVGKEYSYTVKISRTGIELSGAKINKWGTGNTGDDMDASQPDLDLVIDGNTYQIYSGKGLAQFVAEVNDNDSSLNAKLMTNINLAGVDGSGNGIAAKAFTPIASYSGIFDGNGFEISGVYIAEPVSGANGFVRTLESDGVVKNLGISGFVAEGTSYTGSIAGESYGSIFNCYSTATVEGSNAGGFVGSLSSGSISNCYFAGKCAEGQAINGKTSPGVTIEDCYYLAGSALSNTNGGKEITVAGMQSWEFKELLNKNASELNSAEPVACAWRVNNDAYPTLVSGKYPAPNF